MGYLGTSKGSGTRLAGVFNRLYSTYLMPSRLSEYERLIDAAVARGYEHVTVMEFYRLVTTRQLARGKRYFIHRHDIDTDKAGAAAFFRIERKRHVKATYYFRLSTLDYDLMRAIHEYGSEASYHFEELASYCKRHKIRNSETLKTHIEAIRDEFAANFRNLERRLGYKLDSVASHGDFVNRFLGTKNSVLVDARLRKELGIKVEAYDAVLFDSYSIALADGAYPDLYRTSSPFRALEDGYDVIYLLTHPSHWRVNRFSSTSEILRRIYEGVRYKW